MAISCPQLELAWRKRGNVPSPEIFQLTLLTELQAIRPGENRKFVSNTMILQRKITFTTVYLQILIF